MMIKKNASRKKKKNIRDKSKRLASIPSADAKKERKISVKTWRVLFLLIMVVTMVSYANSLTNRFVFDDIHLIAKNHKIRGIDKIPQLLGIGESRVSYRPMRMITYALDYTLNERVWQHLLGYREPEAGLNPAGFHISNWIYHLLTALLVFLVVSRLAESKRVGFIAASLFALHPVHTDSVTYLSGRRDILFTLFYMAGFYFFLRYRQTCRIGFMIASFLAYLLSLGSKEMAVTLPAVFLCYDLVNHFPGNIRRINFQYFKGLILTLKTVFLKSKYLYSLILTGALVYSYYKVVVRSPSPDTPYYGDSILVTFLTMGKILVHYMKLLVYPIRLNADYSYHAFPLSYSFFEPATLFSFVILGITGYGILRFLVSQRMLAFGAIWFFVTLLPVCHIFPHHELLAEHYLYLPSLGFCLIVALIFNDFLDEKRCVYPIYIALLAVFILFSIRIVDRNRDWRDGYMLWAKTVRNVPECARAYDNLGLAYGEKGMLEEAIASHEKSVSINPRDAGANNNLGMAYAKKGRLDEAVSAYKRALAIKPRYADAYYNLGLAYAKKGRLDEAVSAYKKALTIRPRYVRAYTNLGVVYNTMGKFKEALSANAKALAIDPYFVKAYNNMGVIYYGTGKLDKAIECFARARTLEPGYINALNNLGNAYAKKGNLKEAIAAFKETLAVQPDNAEAHYKIASAYHDSGNDELAIKHGERAKELGYKNSSKLLEQLKSYSTK